MPPVLPSGDVQPLPKGRIRRIRPSRKTKRCGVDGFRAASETDGGSSADSLAGRFRIQHDLGAPARLGVRRGPSRHREVPRAPSLLKANRASHRRLPAVTARMVERTLCGWRASSLSLESVAYRWKEGFATPTRFGCAAAFLSGAVRDLRKPRISGERFIGFNHGLPPSLSHPCR